MRGKVTVRMKDFSETPGGRYRDDGPASAQEFREDVLVPALQSNADEVEVDLSGVEGFACSFLEEAFGGAVRELGLEEVKSKISFVTSEPGIFNDIEETRRFIEEAGRIEESDKGEPERKMAAPYTGLPDLPDLERDLEQHVIVIPFDPKIGIIAMHKMGHSGSPWLDGWDSFYDSSILEGQANAVDMMFDYEDQKYFNIKSKRKVAQYREWHYADGTVFDYGLWVVETMPPLRAYAGQLPENVVLFSTGASKVRQEVFYECVYAGDGAYQIPDSYRLLFPPIFPNVFSKDWELYVRAQLEYDDKGELMRSDLDVSKDAVGVHSYGRWFLEHFPVVHTDHNTMHYHSVGPVNPVKPKTLGALKKLCDRYGVIQCDIDYVDTVGRDQRRTVMLEHNEHTGSWNVYEDKGQGTSTHCSSDSIFVSSETHRRIEKDGVSSGYVGIFDAIPGYRLTCKPAVKEV